MSRLVRLALFALMLSVFAPQAAQAGRIGKTETLRPIGEAFLVPGKGSFRLGHKFSTLFLVAGVWVSDDGYVLLPNGSTSQYLPLKPEMQSAFQKAGYLSDPLPAYSLTFWDYLLGYSAWIVILGSILWGVFQDKVLGKA